MLQNVEVHCYNLTQHISNHRARGTHRHENIFSRNLVSVGAIYAAVSKQYFNCRLGRKDFRCQEQNL